jgi:RNA polymerase sigma-70 factor (ECF subfamily)
LAQLSRLPGGSSQYRPKTAVRRADALPTRLGEAGSSFDVREIKCGDSDMQDVTGLLHKVGLGDADAAAELVPLIYDELRRLAAHFMARERSDHTLQTTALVHEAYLRLVQQRYDTWNNRAHFYGAAAGIMRRILVDHARARRTAKRGGGAPHVPIENAAGLVGDQPDGLLRLDTALTRLAERSPRQVRVVELRFFAGLDVEETAEALAVSPKTVKRDWSVARAWLLRELR